MATAKQIEANKQNALLGGVKTDGGKEKSRVNAIKHGFFSQIVTDFDKVAHKDFCNEIYVHFSPANIYEAQLVEIILSSMLAYRRICLFESQLIRNEWRDAVCGSDDIVLDFSDSAYQKQFRSCVMDELLKFNRYKICAFNMMTKAGHELERHVRMRNGESVPFPAVCDINISAK